MRPIYASLPRVVDPTPDERKAWGLDDRETILVRQDGVWAGGTARHPYARRVADARLVLEPGRLT